MSRRCACCGSRDSVERIGFGDDVERDLCAECFDVDCTPISDSDRCKQVEDLAQFGEETVIQRGWKKSGLVSCG